MKRSNAIVALSAAVAALAFAPPANAQCRGIWTKMCPDPPPSGGGDEVYIAPDPAAEKLRSNLEVFDGAMAQMQGLTGSLAPFAALARPTSEVELGSRIDSVIGAIWPEFAATAFEAGRLRLQERYWDGRNAKLRESVSWQQGRIVQLNTEIPTLEQQIAAAGPRLEQARRREAEVSALALAQVNDRTSERRAIATMIAFSPEPYVTIAEMDDSFQYRALPLSPRPESFPYQSAGLSAPFAEPYEPTASPPLLRDRPAAWASLDEKLATMQWVASGWQEDSSDLVYLRSSVPNKRAENAALSQQSNALLAELSSAQAAWGQLDATLRQANARIDASLGNAAEANATLLREVAADIVLDHAAGKMRAIAEEIAGAEGIDIPAPPTDSRQLLDYVRRGGRVVLPVEGYRAQWDAFIQVQQEALDGLGKTQRLMSDAAQALASGSPGEIEAVLDRAFATVKWQTFEYIKTTGFSALPDDEDKSPLIDLLDGYGAKLRASQEG